MNWTWSYCASYCEKTYGTYVDWDEEFFICPECGEPIYKCDWDDHESWTVCPICGELLMEKKKRKIKEDK